MMDVALVRDAESGKSKGFAFLAYEDQRSTTLAVDNLNGASVLGRTVRVEHVDDYRVKRKEVEQAGGVLRADHDPPPPRERDDERLPPPPPPPPPPALPEGATVVDDPSSYQWGAPVRRAGEDESGGGSAGYVRGEETTRRSWRL